jgi:hypothetical protein
VIQTILVDFSWQRKERLINDDFIDEETDGEGEKLQPLGDYLTTLRAVYGHVTNLVTGSRQLFLLLQAEMRIYVRTNNKRWLM